MSRLAESLTSTVKFNDFIMQLSTKDVSDELARKRARSGEGPSIAWIVGHLVHYRSAMLGLLGRESASPFEDRFATAAATDGGDYPSMAALRDAWHGLSAKVLEALESASDEDLRQRVTGDSPHAEKTVHEALAFHAWHEPYHLGQIGMLRSQLGLTPTSTLAVEASRQETSP